MRVIEIGECPIHGTVEAMRQGVSLQSHICTEGLCPVCWIEFLNENIQKVANVRLAEVAG